MKAAASSDYQPKGVREGRAIHFGAKATDSVLVPKRNATQALEAIREAGNRGHNFVVDADIRAYYDSIDQGKLMAMLEDRISDQRMLKLLGKWLKAGVMEDGTIRETLAGTPQGGVISPLLAKRIEQVMESLGLRLHPEKTREVRTGLGKTDRPGS